MDAVCWLRQGLQSGQEFLFSFIASMYAFFSGGSRTGKWGSSLSLGMEVPHLGAGAKPPQAGDILQIILQ